MWGIEEKIYQQKKSNVDSRRKCIVRYDLTEKLCQLLQRDTLKNSSVRNKNKQMEVGTDLGSMD